MSACGNAGGPARSAGPPPRLEVSGDYREIGRQVGEATRELVHATVAHYADAFPRIAGVTLAQAEAQARGYLDQAEKHLPHYVDELRGIAEGAGVDAMSLFVLHCGEEFTAPKQSRPHASGGCTSIGVSTDDCQVVAINMDWYAGDADKNVIVDATLPDGTRMVAVHGGAFIPTGGMTSHGLGYVGNYVPSVDNVVGIPNMLVRRWVLEAPSIDEALERARCPYRARGSNHFLGDANGTLVTLETSATADAAIRGERYLAHTNHYVAPAMAPYGEAAKQESLDRQARAEEMLADGLARGENGVDLVTRVLLDHAHAPDSICCHPDESQPAAERVMTVFSMICDLGERRMYVRSGNPCEGPYQRIQL